MNDPATVQRREVSPPAWVSAVEGARAEGFTFFDWLTAVDQTDSAEDPGFDVVCHLMDGSTPKSLRRIMIRTRVPDGGTLASITPVFRGAAWHERETHEMFGLGFDGFDDGTGQDLRPLLLPDGFEGTPLRKSFVLAARASKAWPGAKEPGESEHTKPTGRRRVSAPGVPDAEWGPR
ncbi:NADH dehydrogenase [Phycicoccus sp. Root563]|uniref:NADH-quinone oxidoreductase subunit C n=1 Tax=unclassified Phycicoccus TaxID=2637926 RepID=UPI000702D2D8|nr:MULTISPECIES: NADH-quinone oxidoreductase subunit C [unclassified Phycicoccus]KQU64650.1 NADH dehydrogenase [Phycicoccus sp. Root101]KQZ89288.1 NADH dehydrogenase [Phycicoccus sp. Root563]